MSFFSKLVRAVVKPVKELFEEVGLIPEAEPPPPLMPSVKDMEAKQAETARAERRRSLLRRGRASTILAGEDDDVPSVRAVLLGQ